MPPEAPEVKKEPNVVNEDKTSQQCLDYLANETGLKFPNLQLLLEQDRAEGFNYLDAENVRWFKPHIEGLKALLDPSKTIVPVTAEDVDSVFFRGDKVPTDAVKRGLLRWLYAYSLLVPDNLSLGADKQVAPQVKEAIQKLGFSGVMGKIYEWTYPAESPGHSALQKINALLKADPTLQVTAEEIIQDAKGVEARLRSAHYRNEAEKRKKAEEAIDELE